MCISNKQSAKMIFGLIDLEQHTARDKKSMSIGKLSDAHTFNCVVLRLIMARPVVKTLL